jgi:hypothetical protein
VGIAVSSQANLKSHEMDASEAKDFLVNQVVQQAVLENVPLSDLEKQMMYFTESPEAMQDPAASSNQSETHHNTSEYEAKMNALFKRAYRRTRKDNSIALEQWRAAVDVLREGDHYILVLFGSPSVRLIPFGSWLRLVTRLAVLVFATYCIWLGLKYFVRIVGISPGIVFGVIVLGVSLTMAIRPRAMDDLAQRGMLWLFVFVLKRKRP